jgi:hypothetical protein
LWYFVNVHTGGSTRESANVYYNLNAGDPTRWLYAPDVSRKEYSDRAFENASGRLTWQVKPRHKVSGFWDVQSLCRACTGATAGLAEPASQLGAGIVRFGSDRAQRLCTSLGVRASGLSRPAQRPQAELRAKAD